MSKKSKAHMILEEELETALCKAETLKEQVRKANTEYDRARNFAEWLQDVVAKLEPDKQEAKDGIGK